MRKKTGATSFQRRILLCATGLTPQVVTETLFALLKYPDEFPTEIHIITTLNGRNRIERDLLDNGHGKFFQFCKDYDCSGNILFSSKNIHVIHGERQTLLRDIQTPEDSSFAADTIMELVKEFCDDLNCSLHVSIAGGRKSMGFLLGYALSIFGRTQDKLSHVLVGELFENNPDFYYPTKESRIIYAKDGSPLNQHYGQVRLAEIPIIKLRSGLTNRVLLGHQSFRETVQQAQLEVAPTPSLSFDISNRVVICGKTKIRLSPVLFATYLWVAHKTVETEKAFRPSTQKDVDSFLSCLGNIILRESLAFQKVARSLRHDGDFLPYFQEKRTLLNRELGRALNEHAAAYQIASTQTRLTNRYYLRLSKSQICLP